MVSLAREKAAATMVPSFSFNPAHWIRVCVHIRILHCSHVLFVCSVRFCIVSFVCSVRFCIVFIMYD